jgi:uncharacterized DUF497 family protein
LNLLQKFECDKNKARSNFIKHQLRFTEGCRIFSGHRLTMPSKQNATSSEKRYTTIGALNMDIAVVVVWTQRLSHIRLISVRKASRNEREAYYANIKKTIN